MTNTTLRRLLGNPNMALGASFLTLLLLAAVFAPFLTPFNPSSVDIRSRLSPPMEQDASGRMHLMGTDSLGRDVFSRVVHGARISLLVGLISAFGAGIVGVLVGAASGFFGKWTDEVLMRLVDIGLSIPFLLLAMSISLLLGPSLLNVMLVLSVTGWMQIARVTRGAALKMKEEVFIEAAHAYGVPRSGILFRHLIPNLIPPIIIIISQQFGVMIYSESTLSYLGLGVPVIIPTWGKMIADGQSHIATAWWISAFPGIMLTLTVIAAFLLGDGLRDVLDPKLRDR